MEKQNVRQWVSSALDRSKSAHEEARWASHVAEHGLLSRHDSADFVLPLGLAATTGYCSGVQNTSTAHGVGASPTSNEAQLLRSKLTACETTSAVYKSPAPDTLSDHPTPDHSTSTLSPPSLGSAMTYCDFPAYGLDDHHSYQDTSVNMQTALPQMDYLRQYNDDYPTTTMPYYGDQFSTHSTHPVPSGSGIDTFYSRGFSTDESMSNIELATTDQEMQEPNFALPTPRSFNGTSDTEPGGDALASKLHKCLSEAPGQQMSLQSIYEWMRRNVPKIRTSPNRGWENSVRHNLSMNRGFEKVPPAPGSNLSKKVTHWRLSSEALARGHVLSTTRYRKHTDGRRQRTASPAGKTKAARKRTRSGRAGPPPAQAPPTSAPAPRGVSMARSAPDAALSSVSSSPASLMGREWESASDMGEQQFDSPELFVPGETWSMGVGGAYPPGDYAANSPYGPVGAHGSVGPGAPYYDPLPGGEFGELQWGQAYDAAMGLQ